VFPAGRTGLAVEGKRKCNDPEEKGATGAHGRFGKEGEGRRVKRKKARGRICPRSISLQINRSLNSGEDERSLRKGEIRRE